MRNDLYEKTPAGQSEIQARTLRLHPRLRSLLVLVDGKHRAGELLDTLGPVGIGEQHLAELEHLGLIRIHRAAESDPAVASPAMIDLPASAADERPLDLDLNLEGDEPVIDDKPRDQLRALYAFFNEAIRDTLGIRGFMLQLEVEKAATLEDYRVIRDTFIAAARKARGDPAAADLAARIDSLLQEPR